MNGHSHSHPHPHPHAHRFRSSRKRLSLAFWTQAAFFLVELIAGLLTNSLALISDAAHLLTDVAAVALALVLFGAAAALSALSIPYFFAVRRVLPEKGDSPLWHST